MWSFGCDDPQSTGGLQASVVPPNQVAEGCLDKCSIVMPSLRYSGWPQQGVDGAGRSCLGPDLEGDPGQCLAVAEVGFDQDDLADAKKWSANYGRRSKRGLARHIASPTRAVTDFLAHRRSSEWVQQ
jgi:hypothetical protein